MLTRHVWRVDTLTTPAPSEPVRPALGATPTAVEPFGGQIPVLVPRKTTSLTPARLAGAPFTPETYLA